MTESSDSKACAPVLELPFDRVVVTDGGTNRDLSPVEFFALPLAQRIRYIVQQQASFFADGESVDAREVLGQMRKIRAALH